MGSATRMGKGADAAGCLATTVPTSGSGLALATLSGVRRKLGKSLTLKVGTVVTFASGNSAAGSLAIAIGSGGGGRYFTVGAGTSGFVATIAGGCGPYGKGSGNLPGGGCTISGFGCARATNCGNGGVPCCGTICFCVCTTGVAVGMA